MIARLAGTVAQKGIDHVILDVAGVGYLVNISLHTLAALPEVGKPATLLTYLHVREDSMTLFGFGSAEERAAFEICFAVQGVGPKLVISILSTLEPKMLADAIRHKDTVRLRKIPGVGGKTAERLVLELGDKLDRLSPAGALSRPSIDGPSGKNADSIASALINLGYRKDEAERAANEVARAQPDAPVAELIKKALRTLAE